MASSVLGECLDLVLEAKLDEALSKLAAEFAAATQQGAASRIAGVAAFASAIAGRHEAAKRWSELARGGADDVGSRAITSAVEQFSACVAPPGEGGTRHGEVTFDPAWPDEDGCVGGYLAIEASMSSGRLIDAERWANEYVARRWTSSLQAPIFARIGLARALAFQGKVGEAVDVVSLAQEEAESYGGLAARMLAAATGAYIEAQRENGAETERLATLVVALDPDPRSYVPVGAHILCAYGLAAVGNTDRAAQIVLHASGGAALPRLQTVDRAYAYELLATAAIESGDLRAARGWGRRVAPLQIHDMAAAAVERTLSRIDVASGNNESGAERAAISAARALIAGGRLDATRARVLEAAALAATGARGAAVAGLRDAADEATLLGAIAVRNWSARELRRLGRRLRPAAGAGWQVLSEREQQVTLLAAEGYSNRMIGQALFLSGRTVQNHLSRALIALGATSRSAIPASLGRSRISSELDGLTERQRQVASLVAQGRSNRAISEELGISNKTVEKHIQAIFSRWHVSSRTGIANRVLLPLPTDQSKPA
ncbi:MAG: LuxR family transcriptional regulator [Salinibacterium sp.]|nr:LuxR family transcriptional regulator [Salinibacterium sp.]